MQGTIISPPATVDDRKPQEGSPQVSLSPQASAVLQAHGSPPTVHVSPPAAAAAAGSGLHQPPGLSAGISGTGGKLSKQEKYCSTRMRGGMAVITQVSASAYHT